MAPSPIIPGLHFISSGLRLLYSYRILYELIGETIYIHGVIHRRRDFKPENLQR